ncbi:MAG: hypothetical protein MI866_00150 [Bacteroidales bacterium]|nr:hypothetical protein [Bacteroidales bacterium]
MKNQFLFIVLFSISILSCEQEDTKVDKTPTTEFEFQLDAYGLFGVEKEFESTALGVDTNHIYFNGRLNQKLCMEAFNKSNKVNLLSWESEDNLVVEVHEGYGVNSTHEISIFRTITPYSFDNKHAYILWGIAEGSQYQTGQRIITSNLYFSSANRRFESMTFPSQAYFYSEIIPWHDDKIMVTKKPVEWNEGKKDSCFCYSITGQEVYKFEKKHNFYPTRNYIAVSTSNYIQFTGDINGTFKNKNIKESIEIWESDQPLNDLPEDTRIDTIELSWYTSNQISCIFKYTLYNGETGSREVFVEIESGKINEL